MRAAFLAWAAAFAAVAFILFAMFRAMGGTATILCVGCAESLDAAQAAFEAHEKPKHYNFDAWRKSGDLRCQNSATLRICQAMPVVAKAHTGEPAFVARDFMSFACSSTECAWVDP